MGCEHANGHLNPWKNDHRPADWPDPLSSIVSLRRRGANSSTQLLGVDELFEFGGALLFSQRQRTFPDACIINQALTRRLGFHRAIGELLAIQFHPHVV